MTKNRDYDYGFHDDLTPTYSTGKGLTEEIVRNISAYKHEPKWMLDYRLKSLELFYKLPMPDFGPDLSGIDFDDVIYFQKLANKKVNDWDDVPDKIKEIVSAVKEDFYIPNSVFLKLRNKIKPIETMPFVENIDIRITGLNSITIRVNENLRAGCISYAGKYVYFDKDGYALEVMNKRLKDVPLVTGLSYDNITIYEKLPVKKKGYFSKIIRITTLITTNELTINEIQFKEDGDIVLKKDDLNVNLGTGDDLDAQLSVLPGIFESLEGKSGTVYMDQYTKESKIITFRTKK